MKRYVRVRNYSIYTYTNKDRKIEREKGSKRALCVRMTVVIAAAAATNTV